MSTTATRKETGCLFNGAMVRAILNGKTHMRRIVNRVKRHGKITQFGRSDTPDYDWRFRCRRGLWQEYRHADFLKLSPLGGIGDLVYVRETFYRGVAGCIGAEGDYASWNTHDIQYLEQRTENGPKSDINRTFMVKRPSIHMPKWAARLWLEITGLRVERVRDISEEDAIAEGVTCVAEFRELWISLYGEESWERDWVWVNEFKRVDH